MGAAWPSLIAVTPVVEGYARELGPAVVMSSFVEAFRQGTSGMVQEYRLHGQPWDFSFEEVTAPVHIWHGDEDRVVPMHHAQDLAARLPGATVHVLENTGHFSIQRHYGTMLDILLSE